jgi:hypothetical protein
LLVAGGIDLPSMKAAMGNSHITTEEIVDETEVDAAFTERAFAANGALVRWGVE